MSNIILSICIPTYNRAKYIPYTIDSILKQISPALREKIEICISDNASNDGTDKIVQSYIEKDICQINYNVNKVNLGADKNYLKVVEIAKGEFCWFLGSDDALQANSLVNIITELQKHNTDIIVFDRLDYREELDQEHFLSKSNWFELKQSRLFDFSKIPFTEYLKKTKSLGAIFSYISSIIFRKSRWDSIEDKTRYVGSLYSHVYVLTLMCKLGAKLQYLDDILVLCRNNNDSVSFHSQIGNYNRFLVDFNYFMIFYDIFGFDSSEVDYLRQIFYQERRFIDLILLKLKIGYKKSKNLHNILYNAGLFKYYLFLKFIPYKFVKMLFQIYKGIKH